MINRAKLTIGYRTRRKCNAQPKLENSIQKVDAAKLTDWDMPQV